MASKDPTDLQSKWYHQFFSFDVSLCMINRSASRSDYTHVHVWNYKDLQMGLKHLCECGMCSLDAYVSLNSLLHMLHNGIYLDAHYMMPSLIHSERIMNIIYYLDSLEPSDVVPKEIFMGAMIEHQVANGLDEHGEKIDAPFEDLIDSVVVGVYDSSMVDNDFDSSTFDPFQWDADDDPISVTADVYNPTYDDVTVIE
jgi:hypothetical protein